MELKLVSHSEICFFFSVVSFITTRFVILLDLKKNWTQQKAELHCWAVSSSSLQLHLISPPLMWRSPHQNGGRGDGARGQGGGLGL